MIFQAYRLPFSFPFCFSASSSNNAVLRLMDTSLISVPAGLVRSSFAEAFADVKRLRASGYVAAVRVLLLNQSTTI